MPSKSNRRRRRRIRQGQDPIRRMFNSAIKGAIWQAKMWRKMTVAMDGAANAVSEFKVMAERRQPGETGYTIELLPPKGRT